MATEPRPGRGVVARGWPTVRLLLRLGLGAAFVYAGAIKIAHPDQFAEIVFDYYVLPYSLVNLVAIWLPVFEVAVGLGLLAGVWVRASALSVAGMMVIFIAAIGWALHRGIALHCGCFTTNSESHVRTWTSLWQEGALLVLAVVLWVGYWPRRDGARADENLDVLGRS